jgi:hypothetical protein
MAISRVSSASAQAATITIPSHQAGDLIFMMAARNNTTPPTTPAGWIGLSTLGASGSSLVAAFKIASTNSEASGTWTNAVSLHCATYRSSAGLVMGSFVTSVGNATNNGLVYAANTGYRTGLNDNWWIGGVVQLNSANTLETAPAGMANINVESSSGVWKSALHDTNATQASNWPTTNVTVVNSASWRTFVAQVFEVTGPTFGGGGLILFRAMNGGYSA